MRFNFHPEAEEELLYSIDYYENCAAGLGHDFAVEVYSTIERIVAYPQAWSRLDGDVRRCQTRRFPYGILYTENNNTILVLAVMHLHRDPDCWKKRG